MSLLVGCPVNTKWSILNHIYTNNKKKLSRLYLCICAYKKIIIIAIREEEAVKFYDRGRHMEEVCGRCVTEVGEKVKAI